MIDWSQVRFAEPAPLTGDILADAAPRPYSVQWSERPSGNGVYNVYVIDANDRKIAAVWGGAEKLATANLIRRACNLVRRKGPPPAAEPA